MNKISSKEIFIKRLSFLAYHLKLDIFHRLANRTGITVIFYHDIVKRSPIPETKLFVDEDIFWQHLSEIQKRYEIISLTDLLTENVSNKNQLVLTFDGYSKSFLPIALKLSREKVKALFYLQTEPILKGEPHFIQKWFWLFRKLRHVHIQFKSGNIRLDAKLTDDFLQNRVIAGRLLDEILDQPNADELVDELAHRYDVDMNFFNSRFPPMTPDDVRQLAGLDGIEVGSHTHTHPDITKLHKIDLDHELRFSKELLESWGNTDVIHFCYPNPSGHGNESIYRCLHEAGYKTATTTIRAIFNKNNPSQWPYSIPRFSFANVSFAIAQGQFMGIDRLANRLQAMKESWRINNR